LRYCDVGCDIDGVLTTGFRPEEPDYVIISGRKTDDWPNTLKDFGGLDRRIYLRPLHFPGDSPHWKAAMIQWLKITRFYEDDPGQAREIRRICPECVVMIVKDGKVVGQLG
jgi:hypothetical protein